MAAIEKHRKGANNGQRPDRSPFPDRPAGDGAEIDLGAIPGRPVGERGSVGALAVVGAFTVFFDCRHGGPPKPVVNFP